MINGIGPVSGNRPPADASRVSGDAAVQHTEAVRATGGPTTAEATPARRMAADGAPVDSAKVEAIRARIAAGAFAIDPDAIAAAMIAQDLDSRNP